MRYLSLFLLLLLCHTLRAQEVDRTFTPWSGGKETRPIAPDSVLVHGKVSVMESERIKGMMADYAARRRPLEGFRVQIYLGERSQAESIRRTFLVQHPELPAYLSYLAPNFRVRIGDLRARAEAENLRETLRTEFPGLYVVPDQIEPPRLP